MEYKIKRLINGDARAWFIECVTRDVQHIYAAYTAEEDCARVFKNIAGTDPAKWPSKSSRCKEPGLVGKVFFIHSKSN